MGRFIWGPIGDSGRPIGPIVSRPIGTQGGILGTYEAVQAKASRAMSLDGKIVPLLIVLIIFFLVSYSF